MHAATLTLSNHYNYCLDWYKKRIGLTHFTSCICFLFGVLSGGINALPGSIYDSVGLVWTRNWVFCGFNLHLCQLETVQYWMPDSCFLLLTWKRKVPGPRFGYGETGWAQPWPWEKPFFFGDTEVLNHSMERGISCILWTLTTYAQTLLTHG